MKRKRFSEEQIIRILHEAEALGNVREVCRQQNITEQTLYRWRQKFGGMDISEATRLRALERENADRKRLVGELTLANRMRKDVLGKTWEACLPNAMLRSLWSSSMASANGEPAGGCRCIAAPHAGSQATGNAPRWWHVSMPFQSSIRALGTGRLTRC